MRRFVTGLVGAVAEAAQELRIHRTRVLLSLIGVAVAVAALTGVVGLSGIARQSLAESFERQGGRPATLSASVYSNSGAPIDPTTLKTAVLTAAERYGISHFGPNGYGNQRVQFVDGAVDMQLQLVGVDYQTMHRLPIVDGFWFVETDADRFAPALVVNQVFWQNLGSPDLRSHPTVKLLGADDTTGVIVGVVASGPFEDYPSAFMLLDAYAKYADPVLLSSQPPSWEFWVPEEIAVDLQEAIKRDLAGALGDGVITDVFRGDYAANGEDPFGPVALVASGIAVLILFLGALSLVNISLVTVRQRIREIGIRRSFGATAGRVFFAVMMESVVGTIAAGVVGVFIAVLVVQSPLVQEMIAPGIIDIPPFPLDAAIIGLVSATAVGALAGLLPAIVAVRVKVIDAIRY